MRIAISAQYHLSQYIGGAEVYAHQIATILSQSHQVTYLSISPKPSQSYPYDIQQIYRTYLFNRPIYSQSLTKIIHQIRPDVYHVIGTGLFHHQPLSARSQSQSIFSLLAPNRPQFKPFQLVSYLEWQYVLKSYSRFSILCSGQIDYFRTDDRTRVFPLSPQLDAQFFKLPTDGKTKMKQKLSLNPNAIHLLHISGLDTHHYYKGTQNVIQAVGQLPKKYHLHIVGTGNQLGYFKNQIKKLQLDHRCTIRQNLSPQQLKKLIFASDMLVQPSTSDAEGFGLSIIEAMSQLTLAITTPVIALAPQLRGMVVFAPPNHPQALADMITNHTQPNLESARTFALSFNQERMAQELDALYSF